MVQSYKIKVKKGQSLHHMACPHDCPDTCSVLVTRDDSTGKAVRLQGDPTHPVTRGFLCNKVNHYLDLVYNKNRVLYPHRRIGPKGAAAKFEKISWDEALSAVTDNFRRVIADCGSECIQPFSYSGTLGMLGYWGMDQRFWNKMNAARLEQSICIYAAMWAGLYTYGMANGPAINDACQDGDLIILWGNNLVSTGIHAVPFIQQAKARGAQVVAIDPRMTRTTMLADWHIQPKPGTDGALALGMMKILVDEGLHDIDFLREQTLGWEEFIGKRLPQYPIEKVSSITGLSTADIRKFTLMYASTRKSYIRANYGLNRHQNAGQMCRSILLLPCFTGAWREKCGGVAFGNLEEMWMQFPLKKLQRPDLGHRHSCRNVNMVQLARALSDHLGENDEKLDPPIKHLFVYNSDPANCVPDSNKTRRGLMRDDLFVTVHDTFWTDTCQYADIVLPADTQMEREDLHAAYGYYHFSMNKAIIRPLGESVRNTELFRMLAAKMGYVDHRDNAFTQTDEEMIREIIDEKSHPLLEGVSYEKLAENGWAMGNVESERRNFLKIGWPTDSGKIEIYSKKVQAEGADPYPDYVPEEEGQEDRRRRRYPLQIISSASHYFIGNSFQSVDRLQAMMSRPTIEISLEDAKSRGIADGDLVRLFNDRGETFGFAVLVEGLLPGVLGTQKQFKGSRTPGGVNVNALNYDRLTDFGKSPCFYSVLADMEKVSRSDIFTPQKLQQYGSVDNLLDHWQQTLKAEGKTAAKNVLLKELKNLYPNL